MTVQNDWACDRNNLIDLCFYSQPAEVVVKTLTVPVLLHQMQIYN